MQHLNIKKGYQLPVAGRPEKKVTRLPSPSQVGLVPMWIPHIKPRLKISEGDRVQIGTPVFEDKRNPAIHFSSPAAGTVSSIRFGPRRVIQAIVIDCEQGDEPAVPFDVIAADDIGGMKRSDLVHQILKAGLWWILRQLPFRDMPDPETAPPAILVNLAAKEPFQASASVYLSDGDGMELFAYGLQALRRLAPDRVMVYADAGDTETRQLCAKWLTHTIKGRYPADDPGTVNYHLKQSADQNRAWYITGQDVLLLARFLSQGRHPTERIIALGGPAAPGPKHLRTRLGAPVAHLLKPAGAGGKRLVVGGCMRGFAAEPDGFMGLRQTSLTVLDEGRGAEFLALFNPGLNKPTYSRTFLSALNPGLLRHDCKLNGDRRACIGCMHCADVCPVNILPQMAYKAILAQAVEEYLAHGLLDCVDCGLCSYVCPSKIELSQTFKQTKAAFAKEQTASN